MTWREITPEPLRPLSRSIRDRFVPSKSPIGRWGRAGYTMPAPTVVKWAVLERYGHAGGTWIESGTYLGDTTAFLASSATHVYTIEPEPQLAELARQRFSARMNVTVIEGLSEDHLGPLLTQVEGPVSLWLDGHFSAGITYRGELETPIRSELEAVQQHLDHLPDLVVLIDDVRCFNPSNPSYPSYPSRSWLVTWADDCLLDWTIEHDVFCAWRAGG